MKILKDVYKTLKRYGVLGFRNIKRKPDEMNNEQSHLYAWARWAKALGPAINGELITNFQSLYFFSHLFAFTGVNHYTRFDDYYKVYMLVAGLVLANFRKSNVFGINPIIISILFIILTESICGYARGVIKRNVSDGLLRQLLLEFIATAELCATCFELIIVADNYGVWIYGLFLFILTIWWSFQWDNVTACPYCPIEDIFERKRNIFVGLLLIGAQVLGGLAIYRYIQVLWSFELVETHKSRAFEECTTDLQVSVVLGGIVEGIATCIYRVVSKILAETNTKVANVLDAFFATSLVVTAFNYSGGYMNPALATSLKYGCKGSTTPEHMLVYWLGPMIGAIFSVFVFNSKPIQNIVKFLTGKRD